MSRPLARVRLRLLAEAEAVDEAQRVLSCNEDEARSWLTRRGLLNDRPSRPGRAVVSLEEFELALLTETEPGPGSGKRPDPDAMAAYVEGRPAPRRTWTDAEVANELGVNEHVLRALRTDSEQAGIRGPWARFGPRTIR